VTFDNGSLESVAWLCVTGLPHSHHDCSEMSLHLLVELGQIQIKNIPRGTWFRPGCTVIVRQALGEHKCFCTLFKYKFPN